MLKKHFLFLITNVENSVLLKIFGFFGFQDYLMNRKFKITEFI